MATNSSAVTRRSRILFVSQVYTPSHDAVSQMVADLAKGLLAHGWQVNVLSPNVNYMTGESLPRHEIIDGVRVWRPPGVPLKRDNPFARVTAYGGFFALSGAMLAMIPRPDVVVYLSTPPLIAWSSFIANHWGAKTVYWAQDVYPEVPTAMGYIRNRLLINALSWAEKRITASVDAVVTIGAHMRRVFIEKGITETAIETIPNWSVVKEKPTVSRQDNPLLLRNGIENRFVVQYSGNMGVVHDMAPISAAMVKTRSDADIHWLMIGDGKRKAEVVETATKEALGNVTFLPYQPLDALWISLHAQDVSIVSLRKEMEGLVVPSKLYGALEAGVPVIFIGDPNGEVAKILADFDCGMTVSTGDELADAVKTLKSDTGLRKAMGENGRVAYEDHFSRVHAVERFHQLLSRLVMS